MVRVGVLMAALATAWMTLVAAWGIAGPFPDGHFAATANIASAGANMFRFKTFYPMLWTAENPGPHNYYVHHPFGVFWVAALLVKVLGAYDWVARLPAVVYSSLLPVLLYRTGRAVWGPVEGGIAALVYASLPITLGFSNFHALEGSVIFGVAIALWGYVRYVQTYRERFAIASVLGVLFATSMDWAAYIWSGTFATLLFARLFVLPESFGGAVRLRPLGRYWGGIVVATLLSLITVMYLILSANKLFDLVGAYGMRSGGSGLPLRQVLDARRVWIHLMFPGLAITLAKLALPIILLRWVTTRRWNELLVPIPLLVMATLQYTMFKAGADVHIFWPHYFAPYAALAIAALAATLREVAVVGGAALWDGLAGWGRHPVSRHVTRMLPWTGLVVLALPLGLLWRDGASMVRLARETGGRFNSAYIQSDVDKAIAIRWYLARYPKTEPLALHKGMISHWALQWAADNRLIVRGDDVGTRSSARTRLLMLDTSATVVADLKRALTEFKVTAVGAYWFLDRKAPAAFEAFSFEEREPSWLQWYFRGGTEPSRTIVPDPWVGWEWTTLLGQGTTVPPGLQPRTPNQLRIAHNEALARGDVAQAGRHREQLLQRINLPVTATYSNGTKLLGVWHHRGAARAFISYFEAGPSFKGRAKFAVTGRVLRRRFLSSLPVDPAPLENARPPSPPTELWRAGHLYETRSTYFKRPGIESFTGRLVAIDPTPAPLRTDGPPDIPLTTVY